MTTETDFKDANSDYDGRDLEILQCLKNYRRWIFDSMAGHLGGEIVEIGAGTGNFSELLAPVGSKLLLVEPSDRPFSMLEKRFAQSDGITLTQRDAMGWARSANTASVDAIVMINVLEHIEDDAAMLDELFRVLRPGGKLCIYVPSLMALYSDLDRRYGHFRRYHRRELLERLAGAGFSIVHSRAMDIAGMVVWFILYRLMRSTEFNPALAEIYDRWAVPMLRAGERLLPPPIGKNLLFIGRRDETPER